MSKHGKAARKASFRFHANPASEAVLRVLRAHKRRRAPRTYFYGANILAEWRWFR